MILVAFFEAWLTLKIGGFALFVRRGGGGTVYMPECVEHGFWAATLLVCGLIICWKRPFSRPMSLGVPPAYLLANYSMAIVTVMLGQSYAGFVSGLPSTLAAILPMALLFISWCFVLSPAATETGVQQALPIPVVAQAWGIGVAIYAANSLTQLGLWVWVQHLVITTKWVTVADSALLIGGLLLLRGHPTGWVLTFAATAFQAVMPLITFQRNRGNAAKLGVQTPDWFHTLDLTLQISWIMTSIGGLLFCIYVGLALHRSRRSSMQM